MEKGREGERESRKEKTAFWSKLPFLKKVRKRGREGREVGNGLVTNITSIQTYLS